MNDISTKTITPLCSLCHQEYDLYYRTPRIVPKCGHTFCEKCITFKLTVKVNRRVFVCPQCNIEAVIRKSVAEDIPKNMGIIDIVKTLKKHAYNEWEEDIKLTSQNCTEHKRPLELICETCNYEAICSHCALFGNHRNHSFVKERPANKVDLNELKNNFQIVANSVQQYLLPHGEHNIKNEMKKTITEGLRKQVSNSFKQHYTILQRKEYQLLNECDNIIINEGGIDKNIDSLLQNYDNLKNKYRIEYKTNIENNSLMSNSNLPSMSLQNIEQFIDKCTELHSNLEVIEKHASEHIGKIVKDIGTIIAQTTMFKIQEIPFSIKRAVESYGLASQQEAKSPVKSRTRMKSNHSEGKVKSVAFSQKEEQRQTPGHTLDRTNRSQKLPSGSSVAVKKHRETFSTFDQKDTSQDFYGLPPSATTNLTGYKEEVNKDFKDLTENKIPNRSAEKSNLPPKSSQSKLHPHESYTTGMRNPPKNDSLLKDNKKSREKEHIPPRGGSNSALKARSTIIPFDGSNQQLKFLCPTKEISFQFLSKFQELKSQIDRQLSLNTLELNSKQINDILLPYLLDYIRRKKGRFQIIKLVKNAITDQGMRILLSYLANDTTTEVLNLTTNQLSPVSLDLVLVFADRNKILRTLYLSNNSKISAFQLKSRKPQLSKYQFEIII